MRTVSTLLDLEEIPILWQYLYMNEDHYVTVDNGVAKLEIRMRENYSFHAKNLNFPELPDLEYTDMMIIPNMLGIIDQLKNVPAVEFPNKFKSRWEELRTITLANVVQNRMKLKNRQF
jgi:hypothetical protein